MNHPTLKAVNLEPIPKISLRQMRWRIGPIAHEVQDSYVAKQITEQVFPEVFTAVGGSKGIRYAVWDRGQAAGVVKVEAILVAAGLGEDLMKVLRDNKEGRFNPRWTGERPPIRVSQNTRTGTGNIKLGVFSWEIAEEMIKKGLRIKDKTHKVEVWGIAPRIAKPGTGLLPPTTKPPIQTNKRQNRWTPPKRSNKCLSCRIEAHYIAQCPLLRQDSCDRCGGREHTSRDCVPIQRGHTHVRTGRTGRQWRQAGNRPQSQPQSKTRQVKQPQQPP